MNKKKLLCDLIKLQSLDKPENIFTLLSGSSTSEFSYLLFIEKDPDYIEFLQYLVKHVHTHTDKYWFSNIARICGFHSSFREFKWKHNYIKNLEIESHEDGTFFVYFKHEAFICLGLDKSKSYFDEIGIKTIYTVAEFLDEILKFIKNKNTIEN